MGAGTELVEEKGLLLCVEVFFGLWGDRWGVWRGKLRVLRWVRLEGEGDEASRPVRWGHEEWSQAESEGQ